MNVETIIKNFDERVAVKDGSVDVNRDPLNNVDYKLELKKKVKNLLEQKYKTLDLSSPAGDLKDRAERQVARFLFKPLRF